MKKYTIIIASLLFAGVIFAGPIKDEFFKTVHDIEKLDSTEEARKKQLQSTIELSLKRALLRYYNYPEHSKIKVTEDNYEQSDMDKFTYYIKYEQFIGYFSYSNDPAKYFSNPRDERILIKPDKKDEYYERMLKEMNESRTTKDSSEKSSSEEKN